MRKDSEEDEEDSAASELMEVAFALGGVKRIESWAPRSEGLEGVRIL